MADDKDKDERSEFQQYLERNGRSLDAPATLRDLVDYDRQRDAGGSPAGESSGTSSSPRARKRK